MRPPARHPARAPFRAQCPALAAKPSRREPHLSLAQLPLLVPGLGTEIPRNNLERNKERRRRGKRALTSHFGQLAKLHPISSRAGCQGDPPLTAGPGPAAHHVHHHHPGASREARYGRHLESSEKDSLGIVLPCIQPSVPVCVSSSG